MTSPNRDLVYNMVMNPEGFKKGAVSAEKAARALERRLKDLEQQQADLHSRMETLGHGMAVFGAATGAALAIATHAAIQWETQWTKVIKVLDGTPEQIDALEGQFRSLAKSIPASHEEIAGVAAAAAQLGISKKHLLVFSRTMLDLGSATNLTSEEASFAFARLMNIMGTAQGVVGRLGSSLVALGNNMATTEAEITEMGLRIAGAGHTIGLTEDEVLGFAAALSSVGINAEAGGTAISTSFIKINQAVAESGDQLDTFAQVAGMSAAEFSDAFGRDPAHAIAAFIAGLGRMQQQGGDVFGVLESLGMSEIRVRDAMLRLAGAGDLLGRSLQISAQGWDENIALTQEAQRMYGTAAAQIQIARNSLNDFAIDLGGTFLPVVAGAAATVAELAAWFQALPGPVKAVLGILGVTTSAIALVGAAALLVVPKIADFRTALNGMSGPVARRAQGAMAGLARVMSSPWGLAAGAAITVATVALVSFAASAAQAKADARSLADTFDQTTGAITKNTRLWVANQLQQEGAFEAAREFGITEKELTDAVLGNADAIAKVNAVLQDNAEHARYTQGSNKNAKQLKESWDGMNGTLTASKEVWAAVNGAMGDSREQAIELTYSQQQVAETFGLTASEAQDAEQEITDLTSAINKLIGDFFSVEEAEDAVTSAINRVTESAQENGNALTGNSDAALENRANVRDLVSSYTDLINAHAETGASSDELIALSKDLKEQFIEQMRAAGYGEDQIKEYAKAFDEIPNAVNTILTVDKVVNTSFTYDSQEEFHRRHGMASGGPVVGPGGPKDDKVPAMLSNGEFVVEAGAAKEYFGLLSAINAGRRPVLTPADSAQFSGGNTTIVNLKAYSNDFNLAQVKARLAFEGAV